MSFFSGLLSALPGAVAQGLIWGLMAIGVFITFKVLDLADLTVDGTMATGGAVCIVMMTHGANVWVAMLCAFLAGMLAGLITGILHTCMGIPAILAGILTQLALFSINLRIMDKKANVAINPDNYKLLVSLRNVKKVTIENPIFVAAVFTIVVIALLYWFFGTALGCSIRATGANPNMSRAQGINVDFVKVLGPTAWLRWQVRCTASIRASRMSTPAVALSLSALPLSSSVRCCSAVFSATLRCVCSAYRLVRLCTIWLFRWSSTSA